MTGLTIAESGMTFGPFRAGHCFWIEKSASYRAIQDGVPIAEFLWLRSRRNRPNVWVVEAKSSSPRPETQPRFEEYLTEIAGKWVNALSLGLALCLGRHPLTQGELPRPFRQIDPGKADFRLVLVIRGHEAAWLFPLQDALVQRLRPTVKAWGLGANAVAVINDVKARELGLIH